jgi:short-subunit dehydrogenase involved in D-alanine esterification of teichoic acids
MKPWGNTILITDASSGIGLAFAITVGPAATVRALVGG